MNRHKEAPLHLAANTGLRKLNTDNSTALETIGQALSSLSPVRCNSRDDWLKVGMAIHAATDGIEAGLALWDAWSQQSEKYRPGECLRQWRSFKTGRGITAGTLYHMADVDCPGWREKAGAYAPALACDRPPSEVTLPDAHVTPEVTCPTAEAAMETLGYLGSASARWEYLDAEWATCGYVLRWDRTDGTKTIRPVSRLFDGTWAVGAMPEPRPLYDLPFLRESGYEDPVFLCEGEKDADVLAAHGLIATTSSGGANAASKTDFSPLAGRKIMICPDNDSAGRQYAHAVAKILRGLTPPADVRVLDVADLPAKMSIVDELAGCTVGGLGHE
jgi:hypothetical protein